MPIKYDRATERFRIFGIDLNSPVDATRPGYVPILENMRSYTDGVLEPRQGLSLIAAVSSTNKTPLHSLRRLNDPNSGSWIRVAGIQDTLSFMNSTSTNVFTRAQYNSADVALSGNPLSLVPWRPDQSPSSWMYVGDSTAMRKIIGYNAQSITRGTVHQIGLAPPELPPTVELGYHLYGNQWANVHTRALGAAPNTWVVDGTVLTTAPALATRIPAATTSTRAVFDDNRAGISATMGWCSLVLPDTALAVLGVGSVLYSNLAGGGLLVDQVLPGSSTATAVGSIIYDTSPVNTGWCIIQPAAPIPEIVPNAVVLLAGTVYARVTEVIYGKDERFSFRVYTGLTTIAALDSLQVLGCVRVYAGAELTPAGGDTIGDTAGGAGNGVVLTGGAGTSATKTGWLQLLPTTVGSMSRFLLDGVTLANDPVADDDYCHLSIKVSDITKISQGRLMLDCDNTSHTATGNTNADPCVVTIGAHDIAVNDIIVIENHNPAALNGTHKVTAVTGTTVTVDLAAAPGAYVAGGTVKPVFKKNYFYRAFIPNDLADAAKGQDTSIGGRETQIQHEQLTPSERPGPFIRDPETGLRVRRRDFLPDDPSLPPRIVPPPGTPVSQTGTGDYQWHELIFRRREFQRVGNDTSAGLHRIRAVRVEFTFADTTAVTLSIGSFSMFGGRAPDVVGLGIPYRYRYRYRVSNTGARSNWSPASKMQALPKRTMIYVTVTAPSGQPEVDKIDVQRVGGALTNWLDVGTTPVGTTTFVDEMSDMGAAGAAPFSEDDINYKPWPITDVPFTTTATSVTGSFIITSAPLPTNLAKGTPMRVDGNDTQFRHVVLASSNIYEVEDSLGTITNASVEIPAPIRYGQPLRTMWLHDGRMFGCGDTKNPGTLYWTNRHDPDGVTETNTLEITSTSEPLQNGCSFNGKNYVWSSERMFELQDIGRGYIALEIPGSKGLFAPWCLAVGERIWFLSRDGIYQSGGGDAVSITDETLRPLFVKEGNVGTAVNGFNPPDFAQTTKLRLSYYDGYLYFIYQDTGGTVRCLTYTVRAEKPGWWPDTHLDGTGVATLYGEEGSGVHSLLAGGRETNANLYQITGASDNGNTIPARIRTQAFDAGDRRALKHFGDIIVEADSQGASITAAAYINNHSTTATITPTVLSTSTSGRAQTIIDTSSGTGFEARNLALNLNWASTLSPKLYFWEPSFITLPETSKLRASYWDDCGVVGDKFFQGIKITADTSNVARTVLIEYDGGAGVGVLADTLTIQHNGNIQKEYAFNPAFTAHQVRVRPTDSGSWKNFDYEWVFEPEPPKANRWEAQQTSHGHDGFIHLKAMYVSLASTSTVTLTVTRTDDSSSSTYTIPTTTGAKRKIYVPLAIHKGKSFIYTLTATGDGFRLYKDNTDVYVKGWGSNSAFASRNAFGHTHGDGKVRV